MSEYIIGSYPTIHEDIEALKLHIRDHRLALNDGGIWLFLAILGCWSVNNDLMQRVAFVIAFILFFTQMMNRLKEKRSIQELIQNIKNRISESDLDTQSMNKVIFDLKAIEDDELSASRTLREGFPFMLSWLFFALTFAFLIGGLPIP
jgi:hypothetical protein